MLDMYWLFLGLKRGRTAVLGKLHALPSGVIKYADWLLMLKITQEAEAKVARMKREVLAAQEMLQLENQALEAAEAEFREAEERLRHLREAVLVEEETSLSKMRQDLGFQQDTLASLMSEVSVYKALNAEIKRGTRG